MVLNYNLLAIRRHFSLPDRILAIHIYFLAFWNCLFGQRLTFICINLVRRLVLMVEFMQRRSFLAATISSLILMLLL